MDSGGNSSRGTLLSGRKLLGLRVENPRGDRLGRIEDIMLGARGKEVAYAVVSFGGVLSLGKKLFAIPWSALDVDSPKNKVVLNLDRETISTARGFEKGHGPDSQDWKADAQSPAPERAAVLEDPGPRAEAQGPGATPLGKPAATVGAVPAQDRMEQWGKTWKSHGLERS